MSIVLSSKIHQIEPGMLVHFCPGCKMMHPIYLESAEHPNRPKWTWNMDPRVPSFEPSVVVQTRGTCHYFIRRGEIQFLGDCYHELKGQTVPLPDIPEEDW